MPTHTQNPSEIDALRVRIEELTLEVARLTALLRARPLQPSEQPPPSWWAPLPSPALDPWWEQQPTAVDVRPEEPRTWLVSRAQPPRDYRPLYGNRPDDVKGAGAPLTFGD